jgi:hypothetical protein
MKFSDMVLVGVDVDMKAARWMQVVDEWIADPKKMEVHVNKIMPEGTSSTVMTGHGMFYIALNPPLKYERQVGAHWSRVVITATDPTRFIAISCHAMRTKEGMINADEMMPVLAATLKLHT